MSEELSMSSLESPLMLSSGKVTLLKKTQAESVIKRCTNLKPSCSMRRVNNKGAILILILSFLVTNIYFYILGVSQTR